MVRTNSFKYFIGHNDNDVIRTLCINHPQMTGLLEDLKVIQQCFLRLAIKNVEKNTIKFEKRKIWKKVEKLLKIEFDSNPVYGDDDKYIKTKIKIYGGSVITNFQEQKSQKKKYHASFYQ